MMCGPVLREHYACVFVFGSLIESDGRHVVQPSSIFFRIWFEGGFPATVLTEMLLESSNLPEDVYTLDSSVAASASSHFCCVFASQISVQWSTWAPTGSSKPRSFNLSAFKWILKKSVQS